MSEQEAQTIKVVYKTHIYRTPTANLSPQAAKEYIQQDLATELRPGETVEVRPKAGSRNVYEVWIKVRLFWK